MTPQSRRPDEVWEDENGRRFLGQVPYDVFFENPLATASENRGGAAAVASNEPASDTAETASVEASTMETQTVEASSDEASGSVGDWPSLLPLEVLESEVKSVRNFLNQKLQSVGAYNSAVTMIPVRAATMAALAAIAAEHPGEISWKQDAGYIRDLAAAMNSSVLQRGPKDQRRLLAAFENLADTLNRSRPADLPEPDPDTTLADVAEMRLLMMRIEQAEQRLRTEVSESSFAGEPEIVRHEASMMSALMQAMTTESYGFADDPDFAGYARQVIESAEGMKQAVAADSFADFELNLSRVSGGCQACHRDYKNN